MPDFDKVLDEVKESLVQSTSKLLECSQIEIAVDKSKLTITVILRTKPTLSRAMLATSIYRYPLLMLMNTLVVIRGIRPLVHSKQLTFEPSELMRAAWLDVFRTRFGTRVEDAYFYVPRIMLPPQDSDSKKNLEPGEEWAIALFQRPAPGTPGINRNGIKLFVVHFPDSPSSQLTSTELVQIAQLAKGWNYASPDQLYTVVAKIETAISHARPLIDTL